MCMMIKKMALLLMLSLGSGVALLANELHDAVNNNNPVDSINTVFKKTKSVGISFFSKEFPLVNADYLQEKNVQGQTALYLAVEKKDSQAVKLLLDKEKEINESRLQFTKINTSLIKCGTQSPIDLVLSWNSQDDEAMKERLLTTFLNHLNSQKETLAVTDLSILTKIETELKQLKSVSAPVVSSVPVGSPAPAPSVPVRTSRPSPMPSADPMRRKLSNSKPTSVPAPAPAPSSTPKPNPSPEPTEASNPTIVESPSPRPAPAPASAPSVAPPARKNTASVKRTEPSVPTEDGNVDKVVDNVPNPDNGNPNVPKTEEPKADEPMSTGKKIAIGGAVVSVSAVIYFCYEVYSEFKKLEEKNEEVKEEEQLSTSELMSLAMQKTWKRCASYFAL
jgi:hypothetical protein